MGMTVVSRNTVFVTSGQKSKRPLGSRNTVSHFKRREEKFLSNLILLNSLVCNEARRSQSAE